MPGRNTSTSSYRYGFNGKEKDDKGEFGNTVYDFGARIYSARLGRFISLDPKFSGIPNWSPYSFAANTPLLYEDVFGEAPGDPIIKYFRKTTPQINQADLKQMEKLIQEARRLANKKTTIPKTYRNIGRIPLLGRYLRVLQYAEYLTVTKEDIFLTYYRSYHSKSEGYIDFLNKWIDENNRTSAMKRLMEEGIIAQLDGKEIEIFTDDPTTLSDDYLENVRKRIESGQARGTDWSYASEAYKRLTNSTLVGDDINFDQREVYEFIQGSGTNARKITVKVPAGYTKINAKSHGQAVFSNGKEYITPDTDGHNGGIWKKAGSVRKLGSKSTRDGTYDEDLNKIGG